MKVTLEMLQGLARMINRELGIDGSAKDAFLIDKDDGGYRLERADGRAYGPRGSREIVYWHAYGFHSGIEIGKNLETEKVGE